jgi:Fe-S cluster assembly iron-binding protein IscA
MLQVTVEAQDELRRLLKAENKKNVGVRVFVDTNGREQRDCWILFEEKPRAKDQIVIVSELTFLVGTESCEYLEDKELHYVKSGSKGEFWVNPTDDDEHKGPYPCPACERAAEEGDDKHHGHDDGDDDEGGDDHPRPKAPKAKPKPYTVQSGKVSEAPRLPRDWRPAP